MRRLTFSLDSWYDRGPAADMPRFRVSSQPSPQPDRPLCYSTHVPEALLEQQGDLIDQLMSFAYQLGARHLEVQRNC